MIENNRPKFAELLATISEICKENLTGMQAEMYWQLLKKYTLPDVEKALFSHMQNPDAGRFMPKPADIIGRLEGSEKSRGMQAWSKVYRAIGYPGGSQSVVFDDPIIHVVINDMGGWVKVASLEEKDAPWRAKEFEERYGSYLAKGIGSYPRMLPGRHKQAINGELVDQIFFAGDQEKAKKVYAEGSEVRGIEQLESPGLLAGGESENCL